MSWVYRKEDGTYLVYSENRTHTGDHIKISFTEDLQHASVLSCLPFRVRRDTPLRESLERVEVVVHRQVVLAGAPLKQPARGRQLTTGRYPTREALEDQVLFLYGTCSSSYRAIGENCKVSQTTVMKIIIEKC